MKKESKLKQIFSKLNIFKNLKEWQKISLTVVLGVFLTSFLFVGFNVVVNENFRESLIGYTTGQNSSTRARDDFVKEQVDEINGLLTQFDRTTDYYNEYTFSDLDIYPASFVEREFNKEERDNGLLSGPSGDPDNDGLSNKLEFFYGSSPKKAQTLCDGIDNGQKPYDTFPFVCDGRNDKELVDDFVSPLTGFDLDTVDKFRVLNQDLAIVNNMKASFEKASDEGVSLSTLYQESFFVDFSNELNEFNVTELEDKAVNIIEYRNFRFDIIDVLVGDSEITSISQIYTATEPEQFDSLSFQYNRILDSVKTTAAPKSYVETHKLYHLLFETLIEFSDLRKAGVEQETTGGDEFQNASKQLSIKIGWVYRRLKEEAAANDSKFIN